MFKLEKFRTVDIENGILSIEHGSMVVATTLFPARQDGRDKQSNEDKRTNLFNAAGFGGVVVDVFGNNLCGDNAVE